MQGLLWAALTQHADCDTKPIKYGCQVDMYSSHSILQPSILRPPLIVRLLDLVQKGNFLC